MCFQENRMFFYVQFDPSLSHMCFLCVEKNERIIPKKKKRLKIRYSVLQLLLR